MTRANGISEQYCAVHSNYSALNCNLDLKFFICCSFLPSLVLPTSLGWFFFFSFFSPSLLLLCCQASQVAVSIGTALQSHVASTRSKSRRKGRWKCGPVLVLCPPSGILLLAQLTAVGRGERGGDGWEWPKYWQSSWWGGDAGLLGTSWPDRHLGKNLEVTGLGRKRVPLSGVLAPSLTRQLGLFDSAGACERSVSADVDDLSTASLIPFGFQKVSVWSQTLQLSIPLCSSGFLGSLCILLAAWGRMGTVGARCWWSRCSSSDLQHHFKTY